MEIAAIFLLQFLAFSKKNTVCFDFRGDRGEREKGLWANKIKLLMETTKKTINKLNGSLAIKLIRERFY